MAASARISLPAFSHVNSSVEFQKRQNFIAHDQLFGRF
jgi:hypothetical protein